MAGNSDSQDVDWVEIIEPQSRETMFANPVTGEILFAPPEGARVKLISQNQWWELYDQDTDRNYYYNSNSGDTVWQRPENGADIIPLSILQTSSEDQNVPLPEQNGHSPENDPSYSEHQTSTRKLSEVFAEQQIERLSPFALEVFGQKFSALDHQGGEGGQNIAVTSAIEGVSRNESPQETVECQNRAPSTYSHNSQDDVFSSDDSPTSHPSISHPPISHPPTLHPPTSHPHNSHSDHLLQTKFHLSHIDGESELLKSRTLELPREKKKQRQRLGSNPSPSPVRPAPASVPKNKLRSPAYQLPTITKATTVSKGVSSSKSASEIPSVSEISAVPVAPPFRPKVTSPKVVPLETFKELATHRRGIFRRKVTIANMLAWTKDAIKQSMIIVRDKQLKKEACELFKLVQQFMGDRRGKSKMKELNKLALIICSCCWEKKGLRDELYIQLCRQTTSNPNPKSLESGWQLLSIALAFFPPSIKFRSYLEGFIWRHVEPLPQNRGCPVEVYAQYCHKRVEKMVQTGAKRGLRKPTLEEVIHAKSAPFHPPLFGAALSEVMELQKETHPRLPIPWVVIALCDTVLTLKGPHTEGIFRVPGDIDEVNALKLRVEKGNVPIESLRDPHVPASLLKLWFRELEEPLIPEEYYDECIINCYNRKNALSLVESLPDTNKELLYYLLRFLKNFVTPENIARTKMGLENISMVWAPNFLRCPSDDHALIFQNTQKEMAFLRLLLKYLDLEGPGSPPPLPVN